MKCRGSNLTYLFAPRGKSLSSSNVVIDMVGEGCILSHGVIIFMLEKNNERKLTLR